MKARMIINGKTLDGDVFTTRPARPEEFDMSSKWEFSVGGSLLLSGAYKCSPEKALADFARFGEITETDQ